MPPNQPDRSTDPLRKLASIAENYDSKVRLLFQLQNYISLVRYDPAVAKRDKTAEFRRFVASSEIDLWSSLNKKSDTRKTHKRLQSTRKEVEDLQAELRKTPKSTSKPATQPQAKASKEKAKTPASAPSKTAATKSDNSQRQHNRPVKRKATEQPAAETSKPKSSEGWKIDSDLCWPDQLPSTKRARRSSLITNPLHYVKPAYNGNLDSLLASYRTISDDQEPLTAEQWAKKVELDAESVSRVHNARASGLLAELEANGVGMNKQIPKFTPPAPTEPSYHENLLNHAIHFAKLRSNLRKFHQTIVKRNAQSVEQYFRRLVGAEDRERKELERQVKQIARRTGQEVMKKWKLALKIVEQRREAALAEEKREKGKEYLNQILDNSAKLIESRIGEGDIEGNDDEANTDTDNGGENSDDEDMEAGDGGLEEVRDDTNDANLTLEQLREKYQNMPNLSMSEHDDNDDNESETDEESDDDSSENDVNDKEGEGDPSEFEKPSEEALRLYAETKDDSNQESVSESESNSETDSESGSGSESESESLSEAEGPGLAALLGNNLEDGDEDEDEEEEEEEEEDQEPDADEDEDDVQNGQEEKKKDIPSNVESIDQSQTDTSDNKGLVKSSKLGTNSPEASLEVKDEAKTDILSNSEETDTKLDLITPEEEPNNDKTHHHRIEPPFLLKGHLREYQRNGLDWLAGLVQSGTNGILADEMGLGKTIQTIGLLAWLACEKQIWGPHLIVVPTSVMLNWEMEFKRFAPGFKILTYFGTPQQRKRKRRGWNKEDTWHVCITSYQLVIQDQVVFRGKRWQYMVLDEAHNIKNFRSQRWQALLNFNAQYRLLLTGTPLQNNLVELWSLLYFLMPSSRATQMMPTGFASLDDFQEWFAKPVDQMVEEGAEADDEARRTITKLHQVLRPYLLRRLKVDVEKQMPAKYEHVVYCRLSKRQRYLYDDFMSRASTRATLESGNFMSILNCLMQLRKVCNHPDLFEVRPIVTSYTVDQGIYADYGSNVAPKFAIPEVSVPPILDTLNLIFPNVEKETRGVGLLRQEISATTELQSELQNLEDEISEMGTIEPNFDSVEGWAKLDLYRRRLNRASNMKRMLHLNRLRTNRVALYGSGIVDRLKIWKQPFKGVLTSLEREATMKPIIERFAFVTPPIVTLDYTEALLGKEIQSRIYKDHEFASVRDKALFHEAQVRLSIAFPDKRLLQYDCGKLQKLAILLRDLISNGHRCLIFTQMTKVLDILEQFLNLHGWRYLRLDGATRIEQRQALTERFNKDANIPVFILSTRSGGLGINLTGADTVIFYDSDWNPAMDRQCQDRCHRIGQTRDVHIYRLVSEYTIESNILRKATQKTVLDNVVIQEGEFTTEYFSRMSVQDILGNDAGRTGATPTLEQLESSGSKRLEAAMAQAEDRDDQLAANLALSEARMDQEEFEEVRSGSQSKTPDPEGKVDTNDTNGIATSSAPSMSPTPSNPATPATLETPDEENDLELPMGENEEPEIGHIDDWMIRAIESGYIY